MSKRVLVSFFAVNNDVVNSRVSSDSPNYNVHKYFYHHDEHIIINSSDKSINLFKYLFPKIQSDFPDHLVKTETIIIDDPINIVEIRDKLFYFLKKIGNSKIDIFISPGTPQMQIAWLLLHLSNIADTNLLQGRKAGDSKSGEPEFFYIDIEKSNIPYSAIIKHTFPDNSNLKYPIGKTISTVFDKATKVSLTDKVTVLIRGESGTGKEYLARYIHDKSSRSKSPFVAVNCSALTDEILESRLFGHKKGAFTGAVSDQVGLFEAAEGGTIFLDEIGDISPRLQQSLLKVVQDYEVLPLGETKARKVNPRIITATNKNLEALCAKDKFRWDLYFRLNVVELELPPLRSWSDTDFQELLKYFIREKAVKFNKKPVKFSKEAAAILIKYNFPGNIRELENVIENIYVFCDDIANKEDLPARLSKPQNAGSLKWEDVTRMHFEYVLKLCNGNKTLAAEKLGCSVNTLKKYL